MNYFCFVKFQKKYQTITFRTRLSIGRYLWRNGLNFLSKLLWKNLFRRILNSERNFCRQKQNKNFMEVFHDIWQIFFDEFCQKYLFDVIFLRPTQYFQYVCQIFRENIGLDAINFIKHFLCILPDIPCFRTHLMIRF